MRMVGCLWILVVWGCTSLASGQERKTSGPGSKAETPAKIRGTLPANFGKLNLSDDQKQQIYRLRLKYAEKIEELEKQIEQAKAERNEAYRGVLTKVQRERLDEILRGPRLEAKEKTAGKNKK